MNKPYKFFVVIVSILGLSPFAAHDAYALSCVSTDAYLNDVVGKEEVVIFTATSRDRIEETGYTTELLNVTKAHQGYVESSLFVYHQNDETWGYLCNNGPKAEGSTGLYVATRDTYGKYNVTQRLELTDPLLKALMTDLEKAAVAGEVVTLTKTDRLQQILSTIGDLFREIGILLKEYSYLKSQP